MIENQIYKLLEKGKTILEINNIIDKKYSLEEDSSGGIIIKDSKTGNVLSTIVYLRG